MAIRSILYILPSLILVGCGLRVPPLIQSADEEGESQLFVQAISESVRCQIQNAVAWTVNNNNELASVNRRVNSSSWFEGWGVQYSLTLIVEEKGSVAPSILWSPPSPASAVLTVGSGLNAAATATRTTKMNFFYTVKDLAARRPCDTKTETKYRTHSLLIRDDLGLKAWLANYMLVVGTGAGKPQGDALTDKIKFQLVTGGNVTPSWTMSRLTVNKSGSLLSASRDRSHELLITYGPIDKAKGGLTTSAAEAFLAASINNDDR